MRKLFAEGEYPAWVIKGLIGVYGKDEEEVMTYLIHSWISKNRESLDKLGLSVKQ